MFQVYYINTKTEYGVVALDNGPLLFPTDTEAWEFVKNIMSQPQHPRLMWVRKVKENANPG